MYLKQLVLKGFKSFAVRSQLDFEPGLSVVVGPNGSGKSNISDAVLWVLGEQSPKHLRGQAMEDVIFAGSAGHAPVSMAEVQLVLDNSDHKLPIEFGEVSVIRRIYRSGESEYLLNGSPCRLMDVRDLLHDTGLGRDAHTVISQGSLDEVIRARPEQRRGLIEEAAGILKHRERKERSARKVKAMDEHLGRIKDVQREVNRQLRPLARQASRAKQHEELSRELRELQVSLAVDDLRRLQEGWDELKRRGDEAAAEAEIRATALSDREAELAKYQRQLEQHGLFAGDLGEQRRRWQSVTERIDAGSRVIGERGNGLADRLATLRGTIGRSEKTLQDATAELASNERDHEADAARLAGLKEQLGQVEGELASAKARRRETQARYGRLSAAQREAQRSLSAAKDQLAKSREALSQVEFQDGVLKRRAGELDAQVAGTRGELAEAQGDLESLRSRAKELDEAAARAESEASRLEGVVEERREAASQAQSHRDGLLAEQRALTEVERALDAANPLVARVLASPGDYPGIEGRVSEALSGAGDLSDVVELLLGPDIQGLLTRDVTDAARIAGMLSAGDGRSEGQLALVPVAGAHDDDSASASRAGAGWHGGDRLVDHLSLDDSGMRVAESLLGDVYLADSAEQAAQSAARDEGSARYATRDGVVCWSSGKVTVGSPAKAAAGSLERERRLSELKDELARACASLSDAKSRLDEATEQLAQARDGAAQAARQRATAAGDAESRSREVDRLRSRLDSLVRERSGIDTQREELDAKAASEQPLADEARARIDSCQEELGRLEEQIAAGAVERREQLATEGSLDGRASSLKVDVATISERTRNLERRHEALERDVERAGDVLRASRETERTLEVARRRIAPLAALYDELASLAADRAQLLKDRQRMQEVGSSSLKEAIGDARKACDEARAKSQEATEALSDVKVERARIEAKVDAAVQRITGDLKVPLEDALETKPPLDRAADEQRVSRIADQIEHLGPVNPVAQREYEQLKARADYISSQVADLEGARKALRRIVAAIDRKMRQSFLATFDVVNANFKEIFSRFFPGGSAQLVLTDPDNPDETGVELDVQPAGKRIRRTQLMSGGEQALVSIALLFAVYRTRSVPFYILDEVEPALDDTNLRRLMSFVDDMRHETQLIMITHQRRTMELADVLYGVSMQADGVSKLVSQRMDGEGHWTGADAAGAAFGGAAGMAAGQANDEVGRGE